MCELGAFVMAPDICQKLILVMQSDHLQRSSFITSGAIKYYREQNEHAESLGYQWNIDPVTHVIKVPEFAIQGMLNHLPTAMDRVHRMHAREAFNPGLDGHLVYLTLAFCHLLRAAKLVDLKKCFEFSNIEMMETKLKHCLDILQICELLKSVKHGRLNYYVALVERIPLEIAFKYGTDKADCNTTRWITRIKDEVRKKDNIRIEIFVGCRNV